jgi:hypothetical protein
MYDSDLGQSTKLASHFPCRESCRSFTQTRRSEQAPQKQNSTKATELCSDWQSDRVARDAGHFKRMFLLFCMTRIRTHIGLLTAG